MFDYKLKDISVSYDGDVFTVVCEKGRVMTLTNGAEAREIFLGEVDRKFRRFLNEKLAEENFNVYTGEKE